jgi:hypothetical protein
MNHDWASISIVRHNAEIFGNPRKDDYRGFEVRSVAAFSPNRDSPF